MSSSSPPRGRLGQRGVPKSSAGFGGAGERAGRVGAAGAVEGGAGPGWLPSGRGSCCRPRGADARTGRRGGFSAWLARHKVTKGPGSRTAEGPVWRSSSFRPPKRPGARSTPRTSSASAPSSNEDASSNETQTRSLCKCLDFIHIINEFRSLASSGRKLLFAPGKCSYNGEHSG